MKNTKTVLLIFCLILVSAFVNAQNEGSLEQMTWTGRWTAVCPHEYVDRLTIQHCELCPDVMEPHSFYTTDIEMIFSKDSLQLIKRGGTSIVPFKLSKDNLSFGFTFQKKEYYFRVFMYGDMRILEGKDGLLLVLEKSK